MDPILSHFKPIPPVNQTSYQRQVIIEMSEKLCLQWNDYQENNKSAFGFLRENKNFNDVTLVCEDGQQMEAHKVILASSSPFFEKILKKSKHPHPLIYLKGFQSKDFASILDFLYFGESNVYKEDLDPFLAIAEEIELKGLAGQTPGELLEEQEKPKYHEPTINKNLCTTSNLINSCRGIAIPNQSNSDLHNQALNEKVRSMMEKGKKMMTDGEHMTDGTVKQRKSSVCKVCVKEGLPKHKKNHIESKHLDGITFHCDQCGKTFSSRQSLSQHKRKFHE